MGAGVEDTNGARQLASKLVGRLGLRASSGMGSWQGKARLDGWTQQCSTGAFVRVSDKLIVDVRCSQSLPHFPHNLEALPPAHTRNASQGGLGADIR